MYYENNDYNRYDPQNRTIDRSAGLGIYTSKVYGWMFTGLFVTAIIAFLLSNSQNFVYAIATNPFLFFGMAIAEIILVVYLSSRIAKISYGSAVALFLIYSALNGATLSFILMAYTYSSVAYTFAITAITFGAMSIYGFITKTDLTRVGNMLFMGLIGLVILSLVNIFVHASTLEWVISVLGIFIFLGLTAYDTQKIKEYYYRTEGNYEMARKSAIMGALRLYLDFINLFLSLLRIFGKRR